MAFFLAANGDRMDWHDGDSGMASLLADEAIQLSHTYHFSWGYPDYIKQAFDFMKSSGSADIPPWADSKDMTWKQLRHALETADSFRVRYLVAGNPNTPPNVLDFLSREGSARVAQRVAENPRAHAATLERLARHSQPDVRLAVSENPQAPEGALLALTKDSNADIRYCMAENCNMPLAVLEVLCSDENPYVSARAQASLRTITNKAEVLVPDFSRVARRRIGRNVSAL